MKLSVVILSKTSSKVMYDTTMNCINSLSISEDFEKCYQLEIILIESDVNYSKEFVYPDRVKIITPNQEFKFHKFLNIGIQASTGSFIALCNNDLIFQKYWFTEMLKVKKLDKNILSFSPIDPDFELNKFKQPYELGYKVQNHLKGWCIVCDKAIFKTLKQLDERFLFYYSDNDYSMSLIYHNIKHAVVPASKVNHLHKVSTKEGEKKKEKLFSKVNIDQKLPTYLKQDVYKDIIASPRALKDHLIYYNKYGNPANIDRVKKMALILNKYHLNAVSKLIFKLQMQFKF